MEDNAEKISRDGPTVTLLLPQCCPTMRQGSPVCYHHACQLRPRVGLAGRILDKLRAGLNTPQLTQRTLTAYVITGDQAAPRAATASPSQTCPDHNSPKCGGDFYMGSRGLCTVKSDSKRVSGCVVD